MLRRLSPLEECDLGEIFEREIEEGVHVENTLDYDKTSSQSTLGGFLTAEEHTYVAELPPRSRPRRR